MGWFSKIKKGVSKIGKGIKKVVTKVGETILAASIFIPILPFKIGMKKAIKHKDSNAYAGNDNLKLVKSFGKVILGKNTYDDLPDYYTEFSYDYDEDKHNVVGAVAALIPAIIGYMKNLVMKKKENEAKGIFPPLSPAESSIVEAADEGVTQMKGAIVEEVDKTTGGFLRKHGLKIVGALVGMVVIFIIIKQIQKNKTKTV